MSAAGLPLPWTGPASVEVLWTPDAARLPSRLESLQRAGPPGQWPHRVPSPGLCKGTFLRLRVSGPPRWGLNEEAESGVV